MKKGFTIVEVSILFVIFLIVAFLVVPLSLDDTMQAGNISRWRNVQADFENIFNAINSKETNGVTDLKQEIDDVLGGEIKDTLIPYKVYYFDGSKPSEFYTFEQFNLTRANAVMSVKYFDQIDENGIIGKIMYDVNGITGPNVWGKDVFGFNIHQDKIEPFCKGEILAKQKKDCSRNGTGVCCSYYYLIGGNFDY